MRRFFKLIGIFFSFFIFLAVAVVAHAVVTLLAPRKRWHWMSRLTCALIGVLRRILGIRLTVKGDRAKLTESGNFIISRHIGYIDGMVLGGLVPAIFVSKKEIRRWPVIGAVVSISGTIFIDRQNRQKVTDSLKKIEDVLRSGINVIVFPEGTSTDGSEIRPFQTVFFQAAVKAAAPVVPVSISYERIDGRPFGWNNRDDLCWYGGMNFFRHLWSLLGFRVIEATVTVHDIVSTVGLTVQAGGRKKLSRKCYEFIRSSAVLF